MAALAASAAPSARALPEGAPAPVPYLYVVGCDGSIDKLDTVAKRRVGHVDLTRRPGAGLAPAGPDEDACAANGAAWDPAHARFYTVTPAGRPRADGRRAWRLRAFSVPDLNPVVLPARTLVGDAPPDIRLDADGAARLAPAGAFAPPATLDVAGFAPRPASSPAQVLEVSGDRVLLRLFVADPATLRLAVADRSTHALAPLRDPPSTVAPDVHLAPGGGLVLVEETAADEAAAATGRLFVFDAVTGARIGGALKRPAGAFLAIAPAGAAVYRDGARYGFVDLPRTFPDLAVTRPVSESFPGMFFAPR